MRRGEKRRALDQYNTPDEDNDSPIDVLLRYMPLALGTTALEPCCGTGNMVRPLQRHELIVTTNDVDPKYPADTHLDYLLYAFNPHDWVITNPPFDIAADILMKALRESEIGVALYLRLTFGEPVLRRSAIFDQFPPRGCIIDRRRSFTEDGGKDTATCAWYVWRHDDYPAFFYIAHNPKATRLPAAILMLLPAESGL